MVYFEIQPKQIVPRNYSITDKFKDPEDIQQEKLNKLTAL